MISPERQERWLAIPLLLFLTACSLNTYELGEVLTRSDRPEAGLSVGQVMASLGPPHRLSATPDGYVLAWEHWMIREDKFGLSLGYLLPGVGDLFNIDWGSASTRGTFLLATFDRDHRLIDSTYSEWDSNAGGGQGLQPLTSVVAVVDVNDLLDPMPQHNWGALSLDSLPATLNRESQLDTGSNGIEQRGTSSAVGQHSLDIDN